MPATSTRHEPILVVDTTALPEKEWLEYRRKGVGGSDAAAVMGVSPFTTCRDLYYDKVGIKPAVEEESNWVAKEVGHRLESLVAEIFQRKMPAFKVIEDKNMYAHPDPDFRFMQADLDYLVDDPEGSRGILEIKTTNFFGKEHWADDSIPVNYEYQARHYMAVMDLDFVYFACLYGNNEGTFLIRRLNRDLEIEQDLKEQERTFWTRHVLSGVEPPYTEDVELVLESIRRHYGSANPLESAIDLDEEFSGDLLEYLELREKKRIAEAEARKMDGMMKLKALPIIERMGTRCKATVTASGKVYDVAYKPTYRTGIDKDGLLRLKNEHRELYDEYVSTTESRSFKVEPRKEAKAS